MQKIIYLTIILFTCLINQAYAYKPGQFPGVGSKIHWQKAYDLYQQSKQLPLTQAQTKIHDAIAIYPYDSYFYMSLATITKNAQLKINYLNKAYTLNPDSHDALFNLGKAYRENDQILESAKVFYKYLKIEPKNQEAWYYLGYDYDALRQYDQARLAFANMTYLKPTDYGYQLQGSEFYKLGKYNQALVYYQKACEFNPNNLANWKMRLAVAKRINNQSQISQCSKFLNSHGANIVHGSRNVSWLIVISILVFFFIMPKSRKKKLSKSRKHVLVNDFFSDKDHELLTNMRNESVKPTANDTNVTIDPYVLDSHSSQNHNKSNSKQDIINKVHDRLQSKHDIIDSVHEKMTSPNKTHQNINAAKIIRQAQSLPAKPNYDNVNEAQSQLTRPDFIFVNEVNPNPLNPENNQMRETNNLVSDNNLKLVNDMTNLATNLPVYENYSQASNDLDYPSNAYINLNNPDNNSTDQTYTPTNNPNNNLKTLASNPPEQSNNSHCYENYSQANNAKDYPQTQYSNFDTNNNNLSGSDYGLNSTSAASCSIPGYPSQSDLASNQGYENYSQANNDLEYSRTNYVQFNELNTVKISNNNISYPDLNFNTLNKNQNSDQAKLCTNCGKELDPNFSFCIYCSKVI